MKLLKLFPAVSLSAAGVCLEPVTVLPLWANAALALLGCVPAVLAFCRESQIVANPYEFTAEK